MKTIFAAAIAAIALASSPASAQPADPSCFGYRNLVNTEMVCHLKLEATLEYLAMRVELIEPMLDSYHACKATARSDCFDVLKAEYDRIPLPSKDVADELIRAGLAPEQVR